jgi:hypothetical protein
MPSCMASLDMSIAGALTMSCCRIWTNGVQYIILLGCVFAYGRGGDGRGHVWKGYASNGEDGKGTVFEGDVLDS